MYNAVQAVAAVATFLAACVAVWASFRAPKLAAQFAEQLRSSSTVADEVRRQKYLIFATLLENRSHIAAANCVSALNLIDLIFIDDREVRSALAHFRVATDDPNATDDRRVECFFSIIEKISRHLGLSDKITIADIRTRYYPTALANEHQVHQLEIQQKFRQLIDNNGARDEPSTKGSPQTRGRK